MTDLASLHAAILADPDDDLVRLAYADALEEQGIGPPERIDMIRKSIQYADLRKTSDDEFDFYKEYKEIKLAAWKTFHAMGFREEDTPLHQQHAEWHSLWRDIPECFFGYWRGFACSVICSSAYWKKHGKRLVREHPLTLVQLSDKVPFHNHMHMTARKFPAWLWRFMPAGYIFVDIRDDDWKRQKQVVSSACLAWAKATPLGNPRSSPKASKSSG